MPSQRQFATDYIDVAERIVEFREKYPDGSLQPADLARPFHIVQLGQETYIAVVAAAYRTPDDARPGIGMAYEVFPGRTPYTKGSELQNAETSAWGRAIVAALAADTKRGIASAQEVRNREAEREADAERRALPDGPPAERVRARRGAPAEQQPAAADDPWTTAAGPAVPQVDPWATVPLTDDGRQVLAAALACDLPGALRPLRQDVRAHAEIAEQSVTPAVLDEVAGLVGAAAALNMLGAVPLIEVIDRIGLHLKNGGSALAVLGTRTTSTTTTNTED